MIVLIGIRVKSVKCAAKVNSSDLALLNKNVFASAISSFPFLEPLSGHSIASSSSAELRARGRGFLSASLFTLGGNISDDSSVPEAPDISSQVGFFCVILLPLAFVFLTRRSLRSHQGAIRNSVCLLSRTHPVIGGIPGNEGSSCRR